MNNNFPSNQQNASSPQFNPNISPSLNPFLNQQNSQQPNQSFQQSSINQQQQQQQQQQSPFLQFSTSPLSHNTKNSTSLIHSIETMSLPSTTTHNNTFSPPTLASLVEHPITTAPAASTTSTMNDNHSNHLFQPTTSIIPINLSSTQFLQLDSNSFQENNNNNNGINSNNCFNPKFNDQHDINQNQIINSQLLNNFPSTPTTSFLNNSYNPNSMNDDDSLSLTTTSTISYTFDPNLPTQYNTTIQPPQQEQHSSQIHFVDNNSLQQQSHSLQSHSLVSLEDNNINNYPNTFNQQQSQQLPQQQLTNSIEPNQIQQQSQQQLQQQQPSPRPDICEQFKLQTTIPILETYYLSALRSYEILRPIMSELSSFTNTTPIMKNEISPPPTVPFETLANVITTNINTQQLEFDKLIQQLSPLTQPSTIQSQQGEISQQPIKPKKKKIIKVQVLQYQPK